MPYKDLNDRRAYDRQRRAKLTAFVRERKVGKVCATCGKGEISSLVFHHVDPLTRKFVIGSSHIACSEEAILEEIAKCIVLCRSCHNKLHNRIRKEGNHKID